MTGFETFCFIILSLIYAGLLWWSVLPFAEAPQKHGTDTKSVIRMLMSNAAYFGAIFFLKQCS